MATRHASHVFAAVAFGSVAASFTSIGMTMPGDAVALVILNSLDAGVEISFDGTNTAYELAAAEPLVLNYYAMNRLFPKSTIYLRRQSGAPTAGRIRFTAIR